MKDNNKIYTQQSGKKGAMRIVCGFLCIAFLMIACVGCDSYVSSYDVSEIQNELNAALGEIDSLNEEYAAALQELASLKISQEETKKAMDSLNDEYNSTKKELGELDSSNIASKQEIDSLKEIIDNTKEELTTLKDNYDAAQREIDDLMDQIEDLQNGIVPPETDKKIKIYIDQGHNPTSYHNAGASGNGLYEQDLTYTIGILLADLLKADGRFEVRLSRPNESTVLGTDGNSSLDARVLGAEAFGADYFISLHTNSYVDSSANGIEVYVAEENSTSYDFGSYLLQGMVGSTKLRNRGMKLNPDLRVLKNATMPAALLEMGFISNAQEAALLSEHPELFAQGIYNGIINYFSLTPGF